MQFRLVSVRFVIVSLQSHVIIITVTRAGGQQRCLFRSREVKEDSILSRMADLLWSLYITSCRTVTRIISPEKKRSNCTSDRLLPYNGKIKNAWSYYSTPPVLKSSCLIKHRVNLTCTPLYVTVTFTSRVNIPHFIVSRCRFKPKIFGSVA